ncbi:hypothetical protein [uncultured Endozoicomonas sp.]|uniref:hypothetical protein n=1 Tax=uncultured Endozoicomonas sp. TaxID=432652 RepID=UPI002625D4B5|nr:hypothetical protein [uncultured Endozoicomonas sp.]
MKYLEKLAVAGTLVAGLSVQGAVAGTIIDCKEVKTGEDASFYIADDGWQITHEVREGKKHIGSMYKIVERSEEGIRAKYQGKEDRELVFNKEGNFIVTVKGQNKHYQECDVSGSY